MVTIPRCHLCYALCLGYITSARSPLRRQGTEW